MIYKICDTKRIYLQIAPTRLNIIIEIFTFLINKGQEDTKNYERKLQL